MTSIKLAAASALALVLGAVACTTAATDEPEETTSDLALSCVRPGRACTSSAQCCNNRCLGTGTCYVAPDECVSAGGACTSDAQCCNHRCTSSGRCYTDVGSTCSAPGAACSTGWDCCSLDCALTGYCR